MQANADLRRDGRLPGLLGRLGDGDRHDGQLSVYLRVGHRRGRTFSGGARSLREANEGEGDRTYRGLAAPGGQSPSSGRWVRCVPSHLVLLLVPPHIHHPDLLELLPIAAPESGCDGLADAQSWCAVARPSATRPAPAIGRRCGAPVTAPEASSTAGAAVVHC